MTTNCEIGTWPRQTPTSRFSSPSFSNHLTIHGGDFGLYLSGIKQRKGFNAFDGLNELRHQIGAHVAAIGLKHDRYPDDVLWKILHEELPRMAWTVISDSRLILQDPESLG